MTHLMEFPFWKMGSKHKSKLKIGPAVIKRAAIIERNGETTQTTV